ERVLVVDAYGDRYPQRESLRMHVRHGGIDPERPEIRNARDDIALAYEHALFRQRPGHHAVAIGAHRCQLALTPRLGDLFAERAAFEHESVDLRLVRLSNVVPF